MFTKYLCLQFFIRKIKSLFKDVNQVICLFILINQGELVRLYSLLVVEMKMTLRLYLKTAQLPCNHFHKWSCSCTLKLYNVAAIVCAVYLLGPAIS